MVRTKPSGKKGIKKVVGGEGTATIPIVREKWASDDLAAAALRHETAQRKRRVTPQTGKRGTFSPTSNKKFK